MKRPCFGLFRSFCNRIVGLGEKMLINLNTVFKNSNFCNVSFNFYNIESLKAILNAAKQSEKPAIAAFGEGYLSYMPLELTVETIKVLDRLYNIPVVFHLDHARRKEVIFQAIELGFSSVMYDGSSLSIEENIRNTKEIVEYAQKYGVSVEGELGCMNPEDGTRGRVCPQNDFLTNVDQAARFTVETGVDALAVSVGNAHGVYSGCPHIDFDRILKIRDATHIPLVLHGCSGIPFGDIRKAVQCGIRKINVNTDMAMEAAREVKRFLNEHDENIRMEKVMECAQAAMEQVALRYLDI